MTVNHDITEDIAYDLTRAESNSAFELTNVSYDVSIGNMGFVISANNQNQYQRKTAQYRRDQLDVSQEPGEQSLIGWWLRSQTSWHHGAGINYFEPGLDTTHVSHRFKDSRGINVWNIGEASMLNDTYVAATIADSIRGAEGNDGTTECIVQGDSAGALKKITLNADGSPATATAYTSGTLSAHSSYPFKNVTSAGTRYYAVCSTSIHTGTIGTDSDSILYRHALTASSYFIKYSKGQLWFSADNNLYMLDTAHAHTGADHSTSSTELNTIAATSIKTHVNPNWVWNGVSASPQKVFASGYAGTTSEVWAIGFDETLNLPDVSGAQMVIQMPIGETIKAIKYYMGYLLVGTNRGIRVCPVDTYGSITLGPLLYESDYDITDFTMDREYVYASTTVADSATVTHAVLVRIDMAQPFDDGTFPYAYDLEYLSTTSSTGRHVYHINDKMIIGADLGGSGKIVVENKSVKRASGWLETGLIRFATSENKYFKYLKTSAYLSTGDTINVQTVDYHGNYYDISTLTGASVDSEVELKYPTGGQEVLGIRYIFNNVAPSTTYPILQSYQLKALPAAPRQRIIQYPLSCFDLEMDSFNVEFGYRGRSYDVVKQLEALEETSDFVIVNDYRTDESYNGIIESVEFFNESSADKNNVGFGGTLIVNVRKL